MAAVLRKPVVGRRLEQLAVADASRVTLWRA
jgi:hypothetical protein